MENVEKIVIITSSHAAQNNAACGQAPKHFFLQMLNAKEGHLQHMHHMVENFDPISALFVHVCYVFVPIFFYSSRIYFSPQ
jgi:hypothetical protein